MMENTFQAFLVLVGTCFAAAAIGGSFIFGIAMVCRWLEWAPINTTININNYGEAAGCIVEKTPRKAA